MINKRETQLILEEHFVDCLKFWQREVADEREAYAMAIKDIKCVTKNPFDPFGDLLDVETKDNFIKYKEMNL